jgi:hypothetical protein
MSVIIGNEQDMLYFPYNSEQSEDGELDRTYDAQDFADYFAEFIGNGVFANPSNGLQVLSGASGGNGFVLTVKAGSAYINGRLYKQRRDFNFAVSPAHLTLGRRDIVVVRHDIIARTAQVHYIEGTHAPIPQMPPTVRTDDVFDLKLCEITVNPNAQAITQANILDTRLNSAVCGIVHGVVNQADTATIFNQYNSYLNKQISLWDEIRDDQALQWMSQTETQELDWAAQTERQHLKWREQTAGQQADFGEQLAGFGDTIEEMRLLYTALETGSFALINNNFDDWSVRRGCDKVTTVNADGSISEEITVAANGFLLAGRDTAFNPDGSITETVTFNPWSENGGNSSSTAYTAVKRTVFNVDGTIREEIR